MDLSLDDEIVNSPFWLHKQRPGACEELSLLMIIEDWKAGRIPAGEALGQIHGHSLVDPDDQMLGIAAVSAARGTR